MTTSPQGNSFSRIIKLTKNVAAIDPMPVDSERNKREVNTTFFTTSLRHVSYHCSF